MDEDDMEMQASSLRSKRKFAAMAAANEETLGQDELRDIMLMVNDAAEVKELDEHMLRVMMQKFLNSVNTNIKLRVKFPDQPEKFMESELLLDESITALQALAAKPDLYPVFVEADPLPALLNLLGHENTDVCTEVISLLHELSDIDILSETDATDSYVDALLANDALNLLIKSIDRYDDIARPEEASSIHNILSILENLIEERPVLAETLGAQTGLIDAIFSRLKKGFHSVDANQLYCSEMISILLQSNSDAVKKKFLDVKGLKKLLLLLKRYRNQEPNTSEEIEFVGNIFNSICFSLNDNPDAQLQFLASEGIETMLAIAKQQSKHTLTASLKALDFALMDSTETCKKFVEQSGLKMLFSVFMAKKSKKSKTESETEEHVISIIANLFMNLLDIDYLRLVRKFQEQDYAKVERLVELYDKHSSKLKLAEDRYFEEHGPVTPEPDPDEGEQDEEDLEIEKELHDERANALYLHRLENGLFVLQKIALTIGFCCTAEDSNIKARADQLLGQLDSSIADVKRILEQYGEQIEDSVNSARIKTIVTNVAAML